MPATPHPGRRDPEGRRTAILEAAAELISERGVGALTHRAVATRAHVAVGSTTQYFDSIEDLRDKALQHLADETDEELAAIAAIFDSPGDTDTVIRQCAQIMHDFLCDPRQVHGNLAVISTAMTDPSLRRLALQWSDQLTDILAEHVGRSRAAAAVAYIDGITVHAALHDTPVSSGEITAVLGTLLAMPDTDGTRAPH